MYGDPETAAMRRDKEHQEWLDNLPHCAYCHQPIQYDSYYEIEGVSICFYCLRDYCDEQYRKSNTKI